MRESYEILSHDDSNKTFLIKYKGYTVSVLYPGDIEIFSEITSDHMDSYLTGILLPYDDRPTCCDPAAIGNMPVHEEF
jgi:hypothetical protein